jgi:Fe(3+) dicitrate transport protein
VILKIIFPFAHRPRVLVGSLFTLAAALPTTARAQTAPATPPAATEAPAPAAPPTTEPAPSASPTAPASSTAPPADEGGATVIGTAARALQRIPGAATVITDRELQRTQPLTTNEALRRAPGIYVRDEEGMGLRPNISIRGLDPTRSRRVLLLEDGIPIAINPYSTPDAYYHPLIDRMQRIEVMRGSGNILFGPQTIGGVINYVTAAPPRRETLSLQGLVGDRALLGGMAVYGNTIGNAGFIVSAIHRRGDGFRHMPFEVTDLFGKFRLQMGPRSELLVRLGVYDEGSASTYLGLTQSMFETDPTQNPVPYDWFRVRRYSASVIHNLTLGSNVRLRTLFYGYTTDRNWHRQLYDREPVANLAYARIVGNQNIPRGAIYLRDANRNNDRHFEVWGFEPRLQASYHLGPVRNELDAGMRLLGERALLRVEFGTSQVARTGMLDSEEQQDGLALAGYVQNRLFVTDRLQVTPGVRLESYWYTRTVRLEHGVNVFNRSSGHSLAAIPGLGVSYTLPATEPGGPEVTAFAGAHVGYAPPRITTAISGAGVATQLDAERSFDYELGSRVNIGTWLRSEATLFAIDFQNEIVPCTMAGGRECTEFINGGASRYLGFEGSAQVDFGRLARIPPSVYLLLRYTGVDARFTSGTYANNFVPYAVPHNVMVSAGVDHPLGFSAQATWLFVAQHYTDIENTPSAAPDRVVGSPDGLTGPIPAYNTLDLTARYTHRRTGLGVALSVKNALDQIYIATRLPDGIFPAGFRQLMLTLRWDHAFGD